MTDKEKYKEEGLRRLKLRKKIRNEKYVKLIMETADRGIPFSGSYGGSWYDPSSPTGYSQRCSYEAYGTCQSPCNGDC